MTARDTRKRLAQAWPFRNQYHGFRAFIRDCIETIRALEEAGPPMIIEITLADLERYAAEMLADDAGQRSALT